MRSTVQTFVAEVAPDRRPALAAALAELRTRCTQPQQHPFTPIPSLHFASLTVFEDADPSPLLIFESNFDGDPDAYLDELLTHGSGWVHELFSCCPDYRVPGPQNRDQLAAYLRQHTVKPAAYHVGNVGRSRRRIRQETGLRQDLAKRLDARLSHSSGRPATAAQAYDLIRGELDASGDYGWVGEPHAREATGEKLVPKIRLYGTLGLLVVGFGLVVWRWPWWVLGGLGLLIVTLLIHEALDRPMQPTDLRPEHVRRLAQQEDHRVQNHLASITVVKPGPFRWMTIRLVLAAANLVARTSTNGTLSGIPSIHFAHWSLLDRGRLLFLSNFDGSWENYLDDFIDKASPGLTGIWSNTVGFPRTRLLVFQGSRQGVAFKAFARQHQVPSEVWYSAYPDLTVEQIDSQSTLREGLASRPRDHQLADWLRRW